MEEGWLRMVDVISGYDPGLVARHGAFAHAVQLRYLALRAIRLGLSPSLAWRYFWRALRTDASILIRQSRLTLAALTTLLVRTFRRHA